MRMKKVSLVAGTLVGLSLFAGEFDKCPPAVFSKVKDSIVVISGDKGSGTGFIVEMDGAKWLMTNEHVVRGQGRIRARTLSGAKIIPTNTVDLAVNRDLIRYKIEGDFKTLKWRTTAPSMNEDVWVFGNSDGSGVVTSIGGEVLGLGEDKIEVSAKFVAGNSGSPVVDNNGNVLGIATFAEIKRNFSNWVKAGTRFNDVRRFAETIGGVIWEPLGYKQYLEDCATMSACFYQCVGFMEVIEKVGTTQDKKPMLKNVRSVNKESVSEINKDKKSRKVFGAIAAADTSFEKATRAYKDTKKKMDTGYGKIGRPTETTLKRRQKDIDNAYQAVLKSRKEGLSRAKALATECVVRSERSKVKIEEYRDLLDQAIVEFEKTYDQFGN